MPFSRKVIGRHQETKHNRRTIGFDRWRWTRTSVPIVVSGWVRSFNLNTTQIQRRIWWTPLFRRTKRRMQWTRIWKASRNDTNDSYRTEIEPSVFFPSRIQCSPSKPVHQEVAPAYIEVGSGSFQVRRPATTRFSVRRLFDSGCSCAEYLWKFGG